jgi:serine/threonine protein kinase
MVVDDSNQLPKLVDRYEVVRAIGRGGMGVVYEAVHVDLRKRVAIKTLNADLAADQRYVARFLREGQAIARMRHPNVVEVFDIRAADGLVYLVMEYLEGETLEAFFRRESALDPARAIDLIIPVVAAVATAHDEGIVHRDLKPANVFLARGRTGITPKVLDFGISKLAEEPSDAPELTGSGVMLGTPLYMSPEQIESSRDVGPRSDQYALGVVLYRALTGHPPYAGANAFQVYRLAMQGKPTPPVQRVPSLPEALSDLVLRAMHRDHARRLPSVHELGARLLAFASPATRLQWEDVFGVMEFPLPAVALEPFGEAPPPTLGPLSRPISYAPPPPPTSLGPWSKLFIGLGFALVVAAAGVAGFRSGLMPDATPGAPGRLAAPTVMRPLPVTAEPPVAPPSPAAARSAEPPPIAPPTRRTALHRAHHGRRHRAPRDRSSPRTPPTVQRSRTGGAIIE